MTYCADEAKEDAFDGTISYAALPLIVEQLKQAVRRLGSVGIFGGIWGVIVAAVFNVLAFFGKGLTVVRMLWHRNSCSLFPILNFSDALASCVSNSLLGHARAFMVHAVSSECSPEGAQRFGYSARTACAAPVVQPISFRDGMGRVQQAAQSEASGPLSIRSSPSTATQTCGAAISTHFNLLLYSAIAQHDAVVVSPVRAGTPTQ